MEVLGKDYGINEQEQLQHTAHCFAEVGAKLPLAEFQGAVMQ